ncbi:MULTISPECIES: GTPase Era [unclassified Hahella]|uniref:GTPase Era n=1 Tax=unclassified Hahella TaxID=2624107 RepID=UPI001C1F191A|nr:GTPase Era [Hahella sp. CR1]MBU6953723.1 GTPase Era [Hahella sp. HN01]MDG9671555.1 GTPase Era [Hahella sp. CR1]
MSIEVSSQENSRCGYVAIVGRPNVGKSTLLNHILGQKISITSKKPQTTRHQILGIKTEGDYQAIYVDTPGLHQLDKKALNRVLNKASSSAIKDADVIVFVVDRKRWTEEDDYVLSKIAKVNRPRILAINKVDKLENKDDLLPFIDKVQKMCEFQHIIPLSALRGLNIDRLETVINEMLPQGIHFFPEDQITDRSERFMAVEIIREKVMRQLGNEVPYEIAVEIEQFKREGALLRISALILVEREGQKKIVIGQKGERIKRIGSDARKDMEKLFESKVMLETWVKVKSGWSDNERALQSLGYDDR